MSSEYLEGLLLRALHDPSLSQQAAVFHQLKVLRQNAITTNAARATAMKTVNAKLRDNSTVLVTRHYNSFVQKYAVTYTWFSLFSF